ncbi:histone deacetylase family protein [Roseobacter sinensis]|uniref:Histone deacetylase family protein n=1 Tax=Roseobacter sinensis TaxID=2931391 RepID=A0ABT3B9A8_9RHOB|nr:histone deacetylase family protein [Roseobacter sp. WL0113]MCV3270137.1 histone deacetylase family protein [Roseobacter sp. WL0113]
MRIYYSEAHRAHFPQGELHGGELVTPFERPSRIEYILARLRARGMDDLHDPGEVDLAPIRALCDAGYLQFLETAWAEWTAEGFAGEIIAASFPARRMQSARPPRNIDGKVGYYALASETAITAGTWQAACASAACAQGATAHVIAGARCAFALCRPPGHHATADMYGGYCFLNNAALSAEAMRAGGAARVAVLDIDFHHGNGTQDIFYDREDVFFASLHGAPEDAFPYYLGYADETGTGAGVGATANFPMPPGTDYPEWSLALDDALARIRGFGADGLVVSLGVDAYKEDPISFFKLDSPDFFDAGRRIGAFGLPTVFCMEGGYSIENVGINTVNVLEGFLAGCAD